MHRRDQTKAVVRQMRERGVILLLLEHGLLRLSLPTDALAGAYANVLAAAGIYHHSYHQFHLERELAATVDAQTRI